jgi:hypothetical protein
MAWAPMRVAGNGPFGLTGAAGAAIGRGGVGASARLVQSASVARRRACGAVDPSRPAAGDCSQREEQSARLQQ